MFDYGWVLGVSFENTLQDIFWYFDSNFTNPKSNVPFILGNLQKISITGEQLQKKKTSLAVLYQLWCWGIHF